MSYPHIYAIDSHPAEIIIHPMYGSEQTLEAYRQRRRDKQRNTFWGFVGRVKEFCIRWLCAIVLAALFFFSIILLWISAGMMIASHAMQLCGYHPCAYELNK